jgi:hypothetical protein
LGLEVPLSWLLLLAIVEEGHLQLENIQLFEEENAGPEDVMVRVESLCYIYVQFELVKPCG